LGLEQSDQILVNPTGERALHPDGRIFDPPRMRPYPSALSDKMWQSNISGMGTCLGSATPHNLSGRSLRDPDFERHTISTFLGWLSYYTCRSARLTAVVYCTGG